MDRKDLNKHTRKCVYGSNKNKFDGAWGIGNWNERSQCRTSSEVLKHVRQGSSTEGKRAGSTDSKGTKQGGSELPRSLPATRPFTYLH